jgi:uncharacterized membrane protein YhaH (DUF805 family)
MLNAIQDGFNRYADFSGRSSRSQYWYFLLGTTLFTFVATITLGEMAGNLFTLATVIPSLAVGIRRMHDVGKSGWFIWLPIYNLVLLATPTKVS